MIYFLKKTNPTNKGTYLQIYTNYYDNNTKKKKTKCYKTLGYVDDLIKNGISDPINHYKNVIIKMNEDLKQASAPQISDKSVTKFAGHFLISSLFDLLNIDKTLNIISKNFKCRYKFNEMFRALCYSQILSPGSKLKAFEKIIPNIYGSQTYSYDQVLDAVNFIGSDYHKYIEMLNKHIAVLWPRNVEKVYFDCTNYYFEIDLESIFQTKGPSKENQKSPLVGQALMLDSDQIPLDTEFYPGNESEKPYLRKRIEDMKVRNNITGRVIQVADKGLNCARNIYSAVIEAKDGYIFSKSIKGNNLNAEQKKWILESDDKFNKWIDVRDNEGNLIYKYKTVKTRINEQEYLDYGEYEYKCKINPEDKKDTVFSVKEKRIVTYNPKLAKKQKNEITKEIEKIVKLMSVKKVLREELGDSAKYVNLSATSIEGEKVKIVSSLNEEKIKNDLDFAGYNMIITSEINADPILIYKTYHNLWRIEESFRILKTYLESRPVYLSSQNGVYGHFLICYFSLTLMRLLELKIFKDEIPISQLFDFIRQYNITENYDGSFINASTKSSTYEKIKSTLGLSKLGNLYLSKKDVELLFKTELD